MGKRFTNKVAGRLASISGNAQHVDSSKTFVDSTGQAVSGAMNTGGCKLLWLPPGQKNIPYKATDDDLIIHPNRSVPITSNWGILDDTFGGWYATGDWQGLINQSNNSLAAVRRLWQIDFAWPATPAPTATTGFHLVFGYTNSSNMNYLTVSWATATQLAFSYTERVGGADALRAQIPALTTIQEPGVATMTFVENTTSVYGGLWGAELDTTDQDYNSFSYYNASRPNQTGGWYISNKQPGGGSMVITSVRMFEI